jgi:peptidoglycan/LPS O-acetylase OafA/YrhL
MMALRSRFAPIDFKTRFPALDGIRALAVTMVFVHHYASGTQAHEGIVLRVIHAIDQRLWSGVDLFFVLSGFLITGILYDTREDSKFFRRFYVRRSVRIFPVFYLVAAILLLLTPIFHYQWQWGHLTYFVYIGNYFSYPVVVSTIDPKASVFIGHFWSLSVEEQFYLLWPIVIWLVRDRLWLLWISFVGSVLVLAARYLWCLHVLHPGARIFSGLPFRMDSLLLGGALALLLRGPRAENWRNACKWIFLVSLTASIVIFANSPNSIYEGTLWMTLGLTATAATSVGLIGMVLVKESRLVRVFSLRPLRMVGKYSYGFYILHMLWSPAWSALPSKLAPTLHSHALAGIVSLTANYAVTLLAAKLSYDLYETKFLKLKRGFEYDSELRDHEHAFIIS